MKTRIMCVLFLGLAMVALGDALPNRNAQIASPPPPEIQEQLAPAWRRNQAVTDRDRELIATIKQSPPLQAIRQLLWVAGGRSRALLDIAYDQIPQIDGWQFAVEQLLWQLHQARWECDRATWRRPVNEAELAAANEWYIYDLSTIGAAEHQMFATLAKLAGRGSNDAVLLAAPYLFDRSTHNYSPGRGYTIESTAYSAEGVLRAVRPGAIPFADDRMQRMAEMRRWWTEHAQEFLAAPPSSENATIDEVLNLTKQAMRAHLNARFPPVPEPKPSWEGIVYDINLNPTPESRRKFEEMRAATQAMSEQVSVPLRAVSEPNSLPGPRSYWGAIQLVSLGVGAVAGALAYYLSRLRRAKNTG